LNRRVVVTGVGLVCGCGIGTDEVWRNLLAGKSGIGPVTHFDVTGFDCRIAGEVHRGATGAVDDSGIENADRAGGSDDDAGIGNYRAAVGDAAR